MAAINNVIEHSKAAWGISKLLSKLATNVFSQMRTKRSYEKKIKKLEDERDAKLRPRIEQQEAIIAEMMAKLASHEGVFVKGLKSITYAVGQIGFRQMKPSVELADGYTKQNLIEKFKRRHKKWLRFKPEINKQAILADYQDGKFKKIEGMEIREGEEFFVSLAPRGKDKPEIIVAPLPKK